jgi:hypothetical protein
MTDESDYRVPSTGVRCLGIWAAAFMAMYGTLGVLRNDLSVSLSRSGPGVHLHGPLAWLCVAGLLMMSIGSIRFLAPKSGWAEFDFDARRRRFGPMFALGLMLYVATQVVA